MTHHQFQTQFSEILAAPVSPNLSKRIAVYRNNVFVGLVEALRARYPAIVNAVGIEFFNALARDFAAFHQPRSPVMMDYGSDFPDFIEQCDALQDYPWMSDVARLERGMTEIYHARDQESVSASLFAGLTSQSLATLRVKFIDACALICSKYPLVTLWRMNRGQIEPAPLDDLKPESALVYRENYEVEVKAQSQDEGVFLKAVIDGQNLNDAIETALEHNAAFDPHNVLSFLIGKNLILSLHSEILEVS